MDMELRHLRSFVAVAEEHSFGRAAKRLNVAQPPLSRHIRTLEDELGTKLFDRTSRPIRLTHAGSTFLREARATLDQAERALERGRGAGRGESSRLAVGATPSAYNAIAPAVLRAFRAARPDVALELSFSTIDEQLSALTDGRLDVSFGGYAQLMTYPRSLTFEQLVVEPMMAILPQDHPLAAQESVALDDLAGEPWVVLSRSYSPELFEVQSAACRAHGIVRNVVAEAPDPHTLLALVATGIGVGLDMASLSAFERPWVTFRPLRGDAPAAGFFLFWREGDQREHLQQLLDVARGAVAGHGEAVRRATGEAGNANGTG